jgi:HEAT repeat protein
MIFFNRSSNALAKEDPRQFEKQKAHLLKLLKRPDSEAIDTLFMVVNTYQNPILIKIALTVLSEMQKPEALAVLTNCMFEHSSRLHRGDAARALGYSRSKGAIAPLKRLLETSESEAEDLPIAEGLFAVMCLSQVGILEADGAWLRILSYWAKGQNPEHRVMARVIMQGLKLAELAS